MYEYCNKVYYTIWTYVLLTYLVPRDFRFWTADDVTHKANRSRFKHIPILEVAREDGRCLLRRHLSCNTEQYINSMTSHTYARTQHDTLHIK